MEVKRRLCSKEERVGREVKTRTKNWPLDLARWKLLETLTKKSIGDSDDDGE